MKIAYNDQRLNILRKKEITPLNKNIDVISKRTRKKNGLKDTVRTLGIQQYRNRKTKFYKEKKKAILKKLKQKEKNLK